MTGDVDLSTHDGQLIARIQGAVAKKESDDKSRRIRRKHEELAQAGRVSGGGTRPYGYETDRRTLRPDEAAIIRECAQRALAGDSLRALCLDLNDRDVPTVTGTPWKSQTLKRILTSARISGQRDHHREIVAIGGVAGDHHASPDAAPARQVERPQPTHQPRRPALPACLAASLPPLRRRSSSRARATMALAATSAPAARTSPAAAR